jgi:DNA-directed RNA polymerase specialized sigma24 family protein
VDGSVSQQIALLKGGDPRALEWLWRRYRPELLDVARRLLTPSHRKAADESDIAAGVLNSLWRGAQAGRFETLATRDELWGLLVVLTRQKAVSQMRLEWRTKRGGGRVRAEADLGTREQDFRMEDLADDAPAPELMAMLSEEHERLMNLLRDDDLRLVGALRLLGHSHQEIAEVLGVTVRTVSRKVSLIRATWERERQVQERRLGPQGAG